MNYQFGEIILAAIVLVAIRAMSEEVVDAAGHTMDIDERIKTMDRGKKMSDTHVVAERERLMRSRMEAMRAAATATKSRGEVPEPKELIPIHDPVRHEASDREIKDTLISATAGVEAKTRKCQKKTIDLYQISKKTTNFMAFYSTNR